MCHSVAVLDLEKYFVLQRQIPLNSRPNHTRGEAKFALIYACNLLFFKITRELWATKVDGALKNKSLQLTSPSYTSFVSFILRPAMKVLA